MVWPLIKGEDKTLMLASVWRTGASADGETFPRISTNYLLQTAGNLFSLADNGTGGTTVVLIDPCHSNIRSISMLFYKKEE